MTVDVVPPIAPKDRLVEQRAVGAQEFGALLGLPLLIALANVVGLASGLRVGVHARDGRHVVATEGGRRHRVVDGIVATSYSGNLIQILLLLLVLVQLGADALHDDGPVVVVDLLVLRRLVVDQLRGGLVVEQSGRRGMVDRLWLVELGLIKCRRRRKLFSPLETRTTLPRDSILYSLRDHLLWECEWRSPSTVIQMPRIIWPTFHFRFVFLPFDMITRRPLNKDCPFVREHNGRPRWLLAAQVRWWRFRCWRLACSLCMRKTITQVVHTAGWRFDGSTLLEYWIID